jgi:putative methionine-R-sulfoxide reductase with GAF domain
MSVEQRKGEGSAIHEVSRKIRLSIAVTTFVVVTLFGVILYHLYSPLQSFFDFIPDVSINLIIGISFFLALVGLVLSVRISRQVMRIIHDYSSRLEQLLGITRDLRDEMYGDILLEKILDNAMAITNADSGSILLCEEEKLVFKIVRGEKAFQLVGTAVDTGKGITGWVATTGQTVRLGDVASDSRFNADIDALTGYETKSILCIPLVIRSTVIGVVELLNKKDGHAFRQRDEEVISYLAGQAAISIIRTRFYEDQKNYEIHLTEMLLEAIDVHITEKRGHSRRVARYSNIIAKGLNMPEERKRRIYIASLLHDVGFIKINSEETFRKEEYMRHPAIGYEMIKPITFYADIAPFILHHHERYDGQGYPSQLKGEEIPFEARIIAIAEAFDAMVSPTSYKVPVSFGEAILELRHKADTQFDRALVEIFAENIDPQQIKD